MDAYFEELAAYEESLKVYRDMNNVISTAEKKGIQKNEGKGPGKEFKEIEQL